MEKLLFLLVVSFCDILKIKLFYFLLSVFFDKEDNGFLIRLGDAFALVELAYFVLVFVKIFVCPKFGPVIVGDLCEPLIYCLTVGFCNSLGLGGKDLFF